MLSFFKNIKHYIVNSFWIAAGRLMIFALSFAFITGLANLVPKEVVGAYQYVMSVFAIISITALGGMNQALTRAVARGFDGSLKSMMRLRILFGLIGSAVAIGIGICYLLRGETTLGSVFLIAAPFVPLTDTFSEMAYAFFQGKHDFKKSIGINVVCQALFSLPTLIVIFLSDNLIIITTSFLVFQMIGGLVVYAMARPANTNRDRASERFGFHLTVMGALRTISINIDRVIVWQVAGAAAVASYIFAATPMSKAEQLVPVETLALPSLSQQSPSRTLKKKLWRNVGVLVVAMVPIIAIGYVLTPFVFSRLFPLFPESITLFRMFLFVFLFVPFALLRTSFTAWHHTRELYITETVSPLLKIGCMIGMGIPFGLWGVVLGNVIGRGLEALVISILYARMPVPSAVPLEKNLEKS